MPDYAGLRTEIALVKYQGMSPAQIASELLQEIDIPADVAISSAFNILAGSATADWSKIVLRSRMTPSGAGSPADQAIAAAITAVSLLNSGQQYIYTSQAEVLSALNFLLAGLTATGDVSSASAQAIAALTTTKTNRAAQLGFGDNADLVQEIAAAEIWAP